MGGAVGGLGAEMEMMEMAVRMPAIVSAMMPAIMFVECRGGRRGQGGGREPGHQAGRQERE